MSAHHCRLLVGLALLSTLSILPYSQAHSWLECTDFRNSRCYGWQRGWSPQHLDMEMTYRGTTADDRPACFPGRQDEPNYTSDYPMARAAPGQNLTITYLENGHVTKDQLSERPHPKTFTLHWSPVANEDTLEMRSQLTKSNQLGGEFPFDDGKCSEDGVQPGRAKHPCQATFTVPPDATPGRHQVVWLWKFNKAGIEEYTACFDVLVADKGDDGSATAPTTTTPTPPPPQQHTRRPMPKKNRFGYMCGGQRYDPTTHDCDNGRLCPYGHHACGNLCYDYRRCANGK
ncbi:hypothetical protein THASP1DRAFT_21267 [Thamnocephalis sphaerospora]|uniref:DUF7492 domain-containing protein n=1 Tax=Thamnocephalis sphaerospora TaxID=78915 RepID=A0A4P9XYC7_9FUNG|nr:hypothetical protein THASP1DRAFT_21267 [Thamnocephalis sphaerospora]|eukprot:RKP11112.1 hypothetical protein THASP1DRAFT_21267 [Thamnocephalis sphaerospora]